MEQTNEIREALTTKGMLASISISCWSGNRLDKALSAQQQASSGAQAQGALRVHKSLISDTKVREPIRIAGEARRLHAELTLPWHYDGVGLLPTGMVMDYDRQMGLLKDKFYAAVNDIVTSYPQLVIQAATELGSAFDPADYPHVADLTNKYRWAIRFERLPTTAVDDLRLSVPDEVVEVIERHIVHEHEHLVSDVVGRMADTVGSVLSRLQARQEDDKARIYSSTIEKLNELPDLMDQLNVTGDERVKALVGALRHSTITVEEAKNDTDARAVAIDRLAAIKKSLGSFYREV